MTTYLKRVPLTKAIKNRQAVMNALVSYLQMTGGLEPVLKLGLIGGSDIAGPMGLSPYDPHDAATYNLVERIRSLRGNRKPALIGGDKPKPIEEAAVWGVFGEYIIQAIWSVCRGKITFKVPSGENPRGRVWQRCSPDFVIPGATPPTPWQYTGEIKTVTEKVFQKLWGGPGRDWSINPEDGLPLGKRIYTPDTRPFVPPYLEAQAQFVMEALDPRPEGCFVIVRATQWAGPLQLWDAYLPRDDRWGEIMVRKAEQIWTDHIEGDKPVTVSGVEVPVGQEC